MSYRNRNTGTALAPYGGGEQRERRGRGRQCGQREQEHAPVQAQRAGRRIEREAAQGHLGGQPRGRDERAACFPGQLAQSARAARAAEPGPDDPSTVDGHDQRRVVVLQRHRIGLVPEVERASKARDGLVSGHGEGPARGLQQPECGSLRVQVGDGVGIVEAQCQDAVVRAESARVAYGLAQPTEEWHAETRAAAIEQRHEQRLAGTEGGQARRPAVGESQRDVRYAAAGEPAFEARDTVRRLGGAARGCERQHARQQQPAPELVPHVRPPVQP